MAFVSEIVAKMGLDTTSFKAALTKTTADVGRAGDDIGRKLNRAFGAGDVFRGLMQGLGIQSVQSLVDKLTEGFKEAADQAQEIERITANTASIYEEIFAARRTDEQNLAELRKQDVRLAQEAADIDKKRVRDVFSVSRTGEVRKVGEETVALGGEEQVRLQQIANERASLMRRMQQIQMGIDKRQEQVTEQQARDAETYAKAQQRIDEDRAKFLREQQSDEQQLKQLVEERLSLESRLADDIVLTDEDQLETKRKILDIERQIAQVNEKIVDDNIRRAEAEVRNAEALRDARRNVEEGQRVFSQAFRDRSTFTVAELAQGVPGTSQTTRARAREIQRLEKQAERQRAAGFDVSADKSTQRALDLRKRLSQLSAAERDPLASQTEQLKKANENLTSIKNSLQPASIR